MAQKEFECQCHGCPDCDWKQWRQKKRDAIRKRGQNLPADIPCGQPVSHKRWNNEGARCCLQGCSKHETAGTQYARGWLLGEEPEEALSLPPPGLGSDDQGGLLSSANVDEALLMGFVDGLFSGRLQELEDTVTVLANR